MNDLQRRVREAAVEVVRGFDLRAALEHGATIDKNQICSCLGDVPGFTRDQVEEAIYDFFWTLLRDRLAMPERHSIYHDLDSKLKFRTVRLMPYGIEVLTASQPTAHDPTGLLSAFDDLVGTDLDESIRATFESALFNFQSPMTYVGCAILLGVASEDLIDQLIGLTRLTEENAKLYRRRTGDPKATAADRATTVQEIWSTGLGGHLARTAKDAPERVVLEDLRDVVTVHLTSVALLIRKGRNKGGHPNKLGAPTQPELFASLNLFPMYCREVKKLIDWMREGPDRVL